jgi:hypothetical protein
MKARSDGHREHTRGKAMGQEAKCAARIAGKRATGRLQLETDRLLFRSPSSRLDIQIGEISKARAENGNLIISAKRQTHEFDLGDAAERWVNRIKHPKSLTDKLGVKPEARVTYLGQVDKFLVSEIEKAKAKVSMKRSARDQDLIFLGVEKTAELRQLKGLDAAIKSNGGIWIIFPKGLPELKDVTVIAEAKANGLVATKVARVSDRLTGMKLVIPLKHRG